MMSDSDVSAAKLIHSVLESRPGARGPLAQWHSDMPRLVNGLVARQLKGRWSTTTANVWGMLAVEKYAKAYERDAVTGTSSVALGTGPSSTAQWSGASTSVAIMAAAAGNATVSHQGTGKPYAFVQVLAAVPTVGQFNAGYKLTKTLTPVVQAKAPQVQVGDVFRVDVDIDASTAMTWVALSDPIPAGASILGASGLAKRSSEMALTASAKVQPSGSSSNARWSSAWLAFEEQRFEGYRAFYEYLPKGVTRVSYTFRVSQEGSFKLPSSRVEAMYSPSLYGELGNADWVVGPK
jgi:alpha-2-macroglobulin